MLALAEEVLDLIEEGGGRIDQALVRRLSGMGGAKTAAVLASLELGRRLFGLRERRVNSPADLWPLLAHWSDRKQERFLCASLNGAHELIALRVVSLGLVNRTVVHPREVFADPIVDRACAVITGVTLIPSILSHFSTFVHNFYHHAIYFDRSGSSDIVDIDGMVMTIMVKRQGSMFDISKMIQIVDHVIAKYKGTINYTKLIKELYLADKMCLLEHGYLLTENNFVCMPLGPVLEDLYQLIRGQFPDIEAQKHWNSYYQTVDRDLVRISPTEARKDHLSKNEIAVLDATEKKYHWKTYSELIDIVHDPAICPETVETESSVPLTISSILAFSGVKMESIEFWQREQAFETELDKILS